MPRSTAPTAPPGIASIARRDLATGDQRRDRCAGRRCRSMSLNAPACRPRSSRRRARPAVVVAEADPSVATVVPLITGTAFAEQRRHGLARVEVAPPPSESSSVSSTWATVMRAPRQRRRPACQTNLPVAAAAWLSSRRNGAVGGPRLARPSGSRPTTPARPAASPPVCERRRRRRPAPPASVPHGALRRPGSTSRSTSRRAPHQTIDGEAHATSPSNGGMPRNGRRSARWREGHRLISL